VSCRPPAPDGSTVVDCAIIGGGPAGLTAAIYLGRFRRSLRLFDSGASRASLIPITHNYPGFSRGIAGADLLRELRGQASQYGVAVEAGIVRALRVAADVFVLDVDGEAVSARTVILATGVEDRKPQLISAPDWHTATVAGAIRWCPICDGYEAMDRAVALIATAREGLNHALFLRTYTRRLTLFAVDGTNSLDTAQRALLDGAGIDLRGEAIERLLVLQNGIEIRLADGSARTFDTVYPMVGCAPRVELLRHFNPRLDKHDLLWVDEHQATSIPGLYAAGDVVHALNQMNVGTAHAATAATAVHHSLPRNFR
jgi:thioredoxin reductase (NADPH)